MNTHSIIIIKNEKNEYLQYYDQKWNCYLFLNSKMKNKEDMESIYKVNILKNNEEFNKKEFQCYNIKYKWFSFKEFENDERIQKVNSDIIQFVKSFDI